MTFLIDHENVRVGHSGIDGTKNMYYGQKGYVDRSEEA